MKKLLSLMMLMLLCTSAWAETVTDELTPTNLNLPGSGYVSWTKTFTSGSGAVYAGFTCPNKNYIQLKSDNSSGIVTTTSGGKVKFVQFAFHSSTTAGRVVEIYGKNEAYTSTNDLYDSSKQGTKLGEYAKSNDNDITLTVSDEYKYIGIRSKSGALYLSKILITWEKVTPPAVETPVITFDPAAPYQGDVVTCSIRCATDGAAIQYSTDGENYSNYPDGGFTLTENTTVYAEAKLGEDVSEVASKTIEFKPTVQTVGAFPTEANTDFKFNGEAIVTYNNGKYCYIKDNTSSALLSDNSFTNSQLGSLVGKKITGFKGIMTLYYGLHEVSNINDLAYADDDPVTVTPTERTITEIMAGNLQNEFAVLRGVSISAPDNKNFTITDAEEHTLQGRDNFSLQDFPTDVTDKVFDIEGFVGIYNETIQFYPTKFTDVTPAAPFAIKVNPVAGTYTEPVTVEISTTGLAEGEVATITYTIGDGEQQTYTEPFKLYKSATITVMAECGEKSDIKEYTYTINLPALAFEMTPAPGTYRGEQNVTISCTNAVSDLTVVWAYTPEEGNLIEGDETNMTFTAAKSGVLTIMAQEANTSREYNTPDEGLTYTITEPLVIDGMIVFADNKNDGTTPLDSDGIIGQDTKDDNYIESVSDIEKVYAGTAGLKVGTSSEQGKMTLNLKNTWNATKISFIAKRYNASKATTMTVNGKEFNLTEDYELFEIPFDPAQDIRTITFVSSKYAFLKVINIEGKFYRITVDNEEGAYKGRADVKATLEPELEGATPTLTYTFAEDGATETPTEQDYPEAGVTVLKSGKLTFIARNGETELARWEGNYTITPLIGDVNGDGKVDVGDVNYVISIILGKINPNE